MRDDKRVKVVVEISYAQYYPHLDPNMIEVEKEVHEAVNSVLVKHFNPDELRVGMISRVWAAPVPNDRG